MPRHITSSGFRPYPSSHLRRVQAEIGGLILRIMAGHRIAFLESRSLPSFFPLINLPCFFDTNSSLLEAKSLHKGRKTRILGRQSQSYSGLYSTFNVASCYYWDLPLLLLQPPPPGFRAFPSLVCVFQDIRPESNQTPSHRVAS